MPVASDANKTQRVVARLLGTRQPPQAKAPNPEKYMASLTNQRRYFLYEYLMNL
jgi:hypothetical protein